MKKKKIICGSILLLSSVMALVSCGNAPAVSVEVAKERAAAIKARQAEEDFTFPSSFTITTTNKISINVTQGQNYEKMAGEASIKISIDLENKYIYFESNSKSNVESLEGKEEEKETLKQWMFVKDNKFYELSDDGTDKKINASLDLSGMTDLEIDGLFDQSTLPYILIMQASDFLDIDSIVEEYAPNDDGKFELENDYFNNPIYLDIAEQKFTSSGEGNLGFVFGAKISLDEEGLSMKANTKVNYRVNNYIMDSMDYYAKISMKTPVPNEKPINMDYIMQMGLKVKLSKVSLSYPNLAEFVEQ